MTLEDLFRCANPSIFIEEEKHILKNNHKFKVYVGYSHILVSQK